MQQFSYFVWMITALVRKQTESISDKEVVHGRNFIKKSILNQKDKFDNWLVAL